MSQNRARVPAGVTTGGQFASQSRARSTVTLDATARPDASTDADAVRRLLEQAQTAARFASRRTGQDADDVAGDALLALAEANSRGRPWASMTRSEVNTIVPRIAYRRLSGLNSGEDFEGYRRYRGEIARIEQEENRIVGSTEADRIAERVRMSMPPKRRPRIGYHLPSRDRTDVRIDSEPTDTVLGTDVDYVCAVDDSDDVRQAAFDYRLAEVEQARQEAGRWSAMTILRPAPLPRPNQLTELEATRLRRRVAEMGGARALTLSWRGGQASQEATDAYFAAFGDIDDTERDQVAETFMLAGTPANTDSVFSEVVSAATVRRARGKR